MDLGLPLSAAKPKPRTPGVSSQSQAASAMPPGLDLNTSDLQGLKVRSALPLPLHCRCNTLAALRSAAAAAAPVQRPLHAQLPESGD